MLRKRLAFSMAVLGAIFSSALADVQFVPLTEEFTISFIIQNMGNELHVGDKVFSDWGVVTTDSNQTTAPRADTIKVTGGYWSGGPADGEIGLRFNGGWSAGVNQISDSTITYMVTADAPYLITGNTLYMDAFGADPNAIVSISENVYLEHPAPFVESIADKLVFANGATGTKKQTQHIEFDPNQSVWIVTDVVANGGIYPEGFAHLSRFYQTFSQVPEPATLALLSLGGLVLLARRRRGRQ